MKNKYKYKRMRKKEKKGGNIKPMDITTKKEMGDERENGDGPLSGDLQEAKVYKVAENLIKNDGYLLLKGVVFSESGVFSYEDGKEYQPSSIFTEDYLESIRRSPLVLEHPLDGSGRPYFIGEVGMGGVKQIGHSLNVRLEKDGDATRVVGDISITDEEAMKEVASNNYGVSMGYHKTVDYQAGSTNGESYDRVAWNLRNDHIALTKHPRKEVCKIHVHSFDSTLMMAGEKVGETLPALKPDASLIIKAPVGEPSLRSTASTNATPPKETSAEGWRLLLDQFKKDLFVELNAFKTSLMDKMIGTTLKEGKGEEGLGKRPEDGAGEKNNLKKNNQEKDSLGESLEEHLKLSQQEEEIASLKEDREKQSVLDALRPLMKDVGKLRQWISKNSGEIKRLFLTEELGYAKAGNFDSLQIDMAFRKAVEIREELLKKMRAEEQGFLVNRLGDSPGKSPFYRGAEHSNVLFIDPVMSGKISPRAVEMLERDGK